ncbi:hypothetical protein B0H13DRAFT_2350654 [Mycena leptocephala]|nr:hypothetical protein B0H13DRAFT_2350654 [Mycena leptocephala]
MGKDVEDEIREAREKAVRAREHVGVRMDTARAGSGTAVLSFGASMMAWRRRTEGEDEGRFERFSLSSALETLDVQLIKLIEILRTWGVDWAGAKEMHAVDKDEAVMGEEINLPYAAFCYLIRRLAPIEYLPAAT